MLEIAFVEGCKNTNDLSKALGYKSPEKLYRLERDSNAKPSSDILTDFSNKFEHVNMGYVLTGQGNRYITGALDDNSPVVSYPNDTALAIKSAVSDPPKNYKSDPPSDPPKQILIPQFITVDAQGVENILWVSVRASAGYVKGHADREYLGNLPAFNLPTLRNGTFRTFEVDGDSMWPTLENKEAVVGRWVESLDNIVEDHVHVIVSKEHGILVKRVLNRIDKYGYLVLKSDAVDNRNLYPNIEIYPDDILEVWFAVAHLNAKFKHPTDMYRRINDLEADLGEVMRLLKGNDLLPPNRSKAKQ